MIVVTIGGKLETELSGVAESCEMADNSKMRVQFPGHRRICW